MSVVSVHSIPPEIMCKIFEGLSTKEVCRGIQVCKEWGTQLESQWIWKPRFKEEGIPSVEGIDTKLNVVFGNLLSLNLTFNGKLYGEVENIPNIAKEKYDKAVREREPLGRIMIKPPRFIIDASHVRLPFDTDLYAKLNASNNGENKPKISKDGKKMKVPLTLRNRIKLHEHLYPPRTMMSKKRMGDVLKEVLDQCNSAPTKTTVWEVEKTAHLYKSYTEQKRLVEEQGLELIPLRVRFDVEANIPEGKIYANDDGNEVAYTQTSDMVKLGGDTLPVVIGNYESGSGLSITHRNAAGVWRVSAAPGVPVSVKV